MCEICRKVLTRFTLSLLLNKFCDYNIIEIDEGNNWGESWLRLFLPKRHVRSIFELKPDWFKQEGIKGIVIDLDNTLIPWDVEEVPDEVKAWLSSLTEQGLKVAIISNNSRARVSHFAKPINIPYIHRAKKPFHFGFKRAAKMMGISPGEMAVIGDQLVTDVFGGNYFGAYTILVRPLVDSDAPATKINRLIESYIKRHLYRTGKWSRSVIDES